MADFRNGQFDQNSLVPTGFNSLYGLTLFKPQARGLQITIPREQARTKPAVGFVTLMKLHGDFEIRVAYDLLSAEQPDTGTGAGVNLYILAEKTLHAASLRRCATAHGDAFRGHATFRGGRGGHLSQSKYSPAQTSTGTIGLRRRGTMLQYLVTEEGDQDPRQLLEIDFGEEDIGLIRVEVVTGGAEVAVECLCKELSLAAESATRVDVPLLRAR